MKVIWFHLCLIVILCLGNASSYGNATDPWFTQGIHEGEDWTYSPSLGFVFVNNKPWFYTPSLGFFYFPDTLRREGFGWHPQLGWFWSAPDTYPFLYSYDYQSWVLHDFVSTDASWFWDINQQEWLTPIGGTRPNIVLITADDLGMQVGAYGDDIVRTPNLDKMASEGLLYENAYVTAPSCSSSRSSILTGRHIYDNGQIGLVDAGFSMRPGVATLPALLREAGYYTGIIGKLHVEPANAFPFSWASSLGHGLTRNPYRVEGEARGFVDSVPQGSPFFLYVNLLDPHRPFMDQFEGIPAQPLRTDEIRPLDFLGLDTPEILDLERAYYNSVERLDIAIGLIRGVLESKGIAENTLVIFIGDHGPPFSRAKVSLYEAGTQVPLLLAWPGHIQAGLRIEDLTSSIDLMPTILDLAQQSGPDDLPGASLRRQFVWRGIEMGAPRKYLFTEYFYHVRDHYYPRRAVRDERFKLIHNILSPMRNPLAGNQDNAFAVTRAPEYNGTILQDIFTRLVYPPKYELYDLLTDPLERENLADRSEYRHKLDELVEALDNWCDLDQYMQHVR